MKVRICASIAAEKVSDVILLTRKAELMGADLIELRLDYLKTTKGIKKLVESTSLPLIATNRQYEQGGHKIQSEKKRVQALLDAANFGFRYIDLELTTVTLDFLVNKLKEMGVSIIISFHDFKQTPKISEMEKIILSQIEAGSDICKLVTTANKVDDNISCLLLNSKMNKVAKVICFAMGQKGILSRVLSPVFRAPFTYASVTKGLETALGQLTISELKKIFRSLGVKN